MIKTAASPPRTHQITLDFFAGGALATAIGLRATLLTVGVLGLVLTVAAVFWSPVRRHQKLPVVASD